MSSFPSDALAETPELLTTENVCAWLASLELEGDGVPRAPPLRAREIGGGNLNYAFAVTDAAGVSAFVKQAPDFIKCLGADFKLTTARVQFEHDALVEMRRHAPPNSVPAVRAFARGRCALVLEDLAPRELLRARLMAGDAREAPARAGARLLAAVHQGTRGDGALAARFANSAMCGITEAFVFTYPFEEHETNKHSAGLDARVAAMRADGGLRDAVARARATFATSKEALVHGDFHAGSVMTDGEDAWAIDAEFVFYGPAGFDVGLFLAGYAFAHCAAAARGGAESAARCAALRACLGAAWEAYAAGVGAAHAPGALADAFGALGCELMRRVLGAAHMDDLEAIEDADAKLRAENLALDVGEAMVRRAAAPDAASDGVAPLLGLLEASVA